MENSICIINPTREDKELIDKYISKIDYRYVRYRHMLEIKVSEWNPENEPMVIYWTGKQFEWNYLSDHRKSYTTPEVASAQELLETIPAYRKATTKLGEIL